MGNELAAVVRQFRQRAEMTQEALAERSGVSVSTIRGLETGKRRNPQLASLRQLADALGLPPDKREELFAAAGGGAEPEAEAAVQARTQPRAVGAGRLVPRQLLAPPRWFTGRESELAMLTAALGESSTMAIASIGGMGGIGKTWLALRWAHQQLDRFPDGQLFVNLRGFAPSGEPASAEVVVRGFLEALGVDPVSIPSGTEEQIKLYRSLLADRRMLVVLDNAKDTHQVEQLLPGSPTCTVLVTSRRLLTGLVAEHGAYPLHLDVLPEAESRALFVARLGAQRLAAEPDVTSELLSYCAGLPLALSVLGTRALISPNLPLARLLDDLRTARLDALDAQDGTSGNLRAVLTWSYDALSPAAARMFRLLGLHEGADVSRHAAGAMADIDAQEADRLLSELVLAHLLEPRHGDRFQFHDLLRAYALERATSHEDTTVRQDAVARMVDWYLHAADAASRVLVPHKPMLVTSHAPEHWRFPVWRTQADAKAWFVAEEANLVTAIHSAVRLGEHAAAWQLPVLVSSFLYAHNKRWDLWLAMLALAMEQARLDGDLAGQAGVLVAHGAAYHDLRRYDEAIDSYREAIGILVNTEDHWTEGVAHNGLSTTLIRQGRQAEAMPHLRRAADVYERIGNNFGSAWALQGVASAHYAMGEQEQALEYAVRALQAWRAVPHPHSVGSTLSLLGEIHLAMDRFEDAIGYFDEAVEVRQSLDDRAGVGRALHRRAVAELACGRTGAARQSLERAAPILTAISAPEAVDVAARLAELACPANQG